MCGEAFEKSIEALKSGDVVPKRVTIPLHPTPQSRPLRGGLADG
jgi:hypothetical protein